MLSEKEKLEEELKLLRESLELDVITKDEYDAAKARIDSKLEKLGSSEQKKREEIKVEEREEIREVEIKELGEEQKRLDEVKEVKEKPAEKINVKEVKIEEVKKEEPVKEEVKVQEEKPSEEEAVEGIISEEKQADIFEEEKKSSVKTIVYSAIFIVLILAAYFFFFAGSPEVSVDELYFTPLSLIACSSDNECSKQGTIGICNNPGQENAECEYIEDVKIKLTVLNNDCFNCDTARVLTILKNYFPNLEIKNIDYETNESKQIVQEFGITALPAYTFNSSFENAYNYNKFSSSFNKIKGSFVMKNTVANANYYIDREEIPNKLDLFFQSNQAASSKAEDNLEEFLDVFEDNVDFEKHNEDDKIVKELGINTFPTFLINNKIKFSGVQPADKIKENFCEMNQLEKCELELTKSLV